MRFDELLHLTKDHPLFESGLLLAGDVDPQQVRVQLSRWVRAGKLHRLRRGLYLLAEPYRHTTPHPFHVANLLVQPSYVSLQAALAAYGLIPEGVPTVTSVTTGRPGEYATPLGRFLFRHLHPRHFWGFHPVELTPGQRALVALPEKALLDLIYLTPHGDEPAYLNELRLQHLERLNPNRLQEMAARMASPKLRRAVAHVLALRAQDEASP